MRKKVTFILFASFISTIAISFHEYDLQKVNDVVKQDEREASGKFYETLKDFLNEKSIGNQKIVNFSYHYATFKGDSFEIESRNNRKDVAVTDFPTKLFTYKLHKSQTNPYLMRVIDKDLYRVMLHGDVCLFATYSGNNYGDRYFSIGWDGELIKMKKGKIKPYLQEHGLYEDFINDKPKREARDNVDQYYRKEVNWEIKYLELLAKEMNK